jgi:hypothetical protein
MLSDRREIAVRPREQAGAVEGEEEITGQELLVLVVWADDALFSGQGDHGDRYTAERRMHRSWAVVGAAGSRAAGVADRQPIVGQSGLLRQRGDGLMPRRHTQTREDHGPAGEIRQQSTAFELSRDRGWTVVPADIPQIESPGRTQTR